MFKNATHLKSLANDFQSLDLRNIQGFDPTQDDDGVMYAEAFGDHYRNEAKQKKYTELKKDRKLKKLKKDRNIFSDVIVSRSKELFTDEKQREKFLDTYK